MTDYQYRTILKSIDMILEGCEDISEARKKLNSLMEKNGSTQLEETEKSEDD